MPDGFPAGLTEELGRILGDLPDSVRLIARDGSVLFRNEAARLLTPEGLGHLCEERGGRNASCPACQMDEVFERGLFLRWHVVQPQADRQGDYYEVTLSPIRNDKEGVVAVLEILRDVTATLGLEQFLIGKAEHQEEEIRRRAEEAQAALETADSLKVKLGELRDSQTEVLYRDRLMALSQLVAGLSHEIHTPLGAMLSSAELLRRTGGRLRESLNDVEDERLAAWTNQLESMDDSAEVMIEGARRIQAIVQTLRLFSRLDESTTQPVDVREGLDSTIELVRFRLGDRIRVVRDFQELPTVCCRANALNQVFLNLLMNAIQAIECEGEIRVATRVSDGDVIVDISDTGSGIAREDAQRIFELGFTTRSGRGGSGIGLALCQRIVEEHGGSISVDSAPGRGSTFSVRLPIDPRGGGAS